MVPIILSAVWRVTIFSSSKKLFFLIILAVKDFPFTLYSFWIFFTNEAS